MKIYRYLLLLLTVTALTSITACQNGKSPKITIYVETNDVNPLNAGDYILDDGTLFADIVQLFASNIHREILPDSTIRPTLYLNPELTPVLEPSPAGDTTTGFYKYVKPLQDMGIKVLLTVLGDHDGIGLANMDNTQAEQFATILAYTVQKYGLDGVDFDDEYSDITSTVAGSYGKIINKTRAKLDSLWTGKLVTAFAFSDEGGLSQINTTQGAKLDYAYSNFALYNTTIPISGVTKGHWFPMSLHLDRNYNTDDITEYAKKIKKKSYAGAMGFNMRTINDFSPLSIFQAITAGFYAPRTVSVRTSPTNAGNRPQDWTFLTPSTARHCITYAEAVAGL